MRQASKEHYGDKFREEDHETQAKKLDGTRGGSEEQREEITEEELEEGPIKIKSGKPECVLAPFVSGSTSQQIPFVYLPLKGQIIHPSKEINFAGIVKPVCAISGAKFLTDKGWVELRNPSDTDVPFRLFRDEGRTFLQWEGEAELRNRMGGRLVLVYLMCREIGASQDVSQDLQQIFSPCVAFRVVGTPTKYLNNVSEVIFAPGAQSSDTSDSSGMSVSEIIAIGICSVLLGLIYVASIFLYLHLRKRRKDMEKSSERRENKSLTNAEEGIIKNNPLLGLERHFTPPENSFSDTTGSDTDVTPDIIQNHEERKNNIQITSALIHPYHYDSSIYSTLTSIESCHQDSTSIERLPEENVSIIETLEGREERPENVKAIGTTRKKLYFNPAYFEPQLLMAPPPAAIEFLTKIREVITIAKQKMAAKRFSPCLLGIPEEESGYPVDPIYDYSQPLSSRRGSVISLKRENSRRRICSGCPGCEPQDFKALCGKLPEFPSLAACQTCTTTATEIKQRSIRKWLEDIPILKPLQNIDFASNKEGLTASPVYIHKRIRSPARSLSPDQISSPIRALSPKPSSEGAMSPRSIEAMYQNKTPSVNSKSSNKSRKSTETYRKPIVKPNAPPPPLPPHVRKKENTYSSIESIRTGNKLKTLPPPDMIHEAMVVDNKTGETRIPTITKKKMNAVIHEFASQHKLDLSFSESSPESSKRKPLDYETDSLERTAANKDFRTPTDYADISSSQPSPSLSAALPLEEEMTMRNAIINTKTGNMTISKLNMDMLQKEEDDYELIVLKKEGGKGTSIFHLPELLQRNGEYSLVSEVYVNNGYNYGSTASSISSNCSTLENKPKVRYDNNKPGHLLIEVEDCPDNYIRVEDSDSFEPDTLDRKPSKLSLKSSLAIDSENELIDSLERPNQILLRTTGSFKSDALTLVANKEQPTSFNRNFGSLREIYEAKNRKSAEGNFVGNENTERVTWKGDQTDVDYEGRILTLEERHHKRQRRSTSPTANDIPPDVIPPHSLDTSPIYEQPKPPRKVADLSKPPIPPKTGSVKKKKAISSNHSVSSANSSDYEGCAISKPACDKKCNTSILNNFIHADDVLFKNNINNQFILQASTISVTPHLVNYDEKLGLKKQDDIQWKFKPALEKYLQKPEDPGYLSTDSNESSKKKDEVREANVSVGAGSETDESLGDGHSESGAESVETHSVFFGSFRKPCLTGSLDSGVDSDLKTNSITNTFVDDGASSDSENMSFKTVVTTHQC